MGKQLSLLSSRRDVLRTSVAVGAGAVIPAAATAATSTSTAKGSIPLYQVIHDDRFFATQRFGAEARRLGLKTHGLDGGVHDLWFDELSEQLRIKRQALAGITAHDSLFLLEMMAQDAGMRVIFRAHHEGANGAVQHQLFGPHDVIARVPSLSVDHTRWSRQIAHVVASWPNWAIARSGRESTILLAAHQPLRPDALITWVMAPVHQSI